VIQIVIELLATGAYLKDSDWLAQPPLHATATRIEIVS